MNEFDEFARDDDTGRAVRAAYEAVGPTREAEERILKRLRDKAGEKQKDPAVSSHRRVPRWARIALPAATCLVVALGAGALLATEHHKSVILSEEVNAVEDGGALETLPSLESSAAGGAGVDGAADGCSPAYEAPYSEGYTDAGEPDFVRAEERPLSTFSADVDTASYANLRRLVQSGAGLGTVDPGAVRIEEMLNYFDYDYAAPNSGNDFALTARAGACPWNPESELVVLGLSVGQPSVQIPPTNLVLLVDVSGSMEAPNKLPLLKESMVQIVEGLGPDDRVSIVTYSGAEEVVLKGAHGDDRKAILEAVDSLVAQGSTNGEAGLEAAYRVAEEMHIEGGVNRIVMASDGDLNVGISSVEELHEFVSEKRGQGTYLSVLGFGTGNYQDDKMETLADRGNGSYHYIDSADEAARVYARFLSSGAVPVADDVKLQVEFDPAMVESYRLIGYANRAMADADFRNDDVDAGEICAGTELTVAYEVVLTEEGCRAEGSDRWLTCSVRYQPAGDSAGEAPKEQRFEVGGDCWSAQPGADWSLAASAIEFGMLARNSDFAGSANAEEAIALAKESASSLDVVDRAARRELAEIIRLAEHHALGFADNVDDYDCRTYAAN